MVNFVKNIFRIKKDYMLRIEYLDSQGNTTERDIKVESIDRSNNMINAFCFLRNRARTFRIDRIQRCYDKDSGEFIESKKLLNYLKFVKQEKWNL